MQITNVSRQRAPITPARMTIQIDPADYTVLVGALRRLAWKDSLFARSSSRRASAQRLLVQMETAS